MKTPAVLTSPRAAIMMVFAAFGAALGGIAGSMPVISAQSGLDSLDLGLGVTGWTAGSALMLSLGGLLSRRFCNRHMILLALPAVGLLPLAVLTGASRPVFFISYLAQGLASGLTDVFMNAEGAAVEQELGKPIFAAFHGCVSASLFVFAITASFVSVEAGPLLTGLLVATVTAVAWLMVYRNVPVRRPAKGREARIRALPRKLPLVLLGLAAGLIISAETAAALFSANLLNAQAPQLAAIAGLGAAFFGLCNAVMRFSGDWLRSRFGDLPLMMASLLVAISGFAALGLSTGFAMSVFAFMLVGFGTGILIPCAFALAAGFVPANRAAGISFVSMIAGPPRILAPWVFGWIASSTGIGFAFGLYAGVLALALTLVVALRNGAANGQGSALGARGMNRAGVS